MSSLNFKAANEARTAGAGKRDAQLAAQWLAAWPADWPETWRIVARARAASPGASWAQLGAQLGWTRDRAAGNWRRMMKAASGG
jgi:DNA-binding transcriptional regulator WhiA